MIINPVQYNLGTKLPELANPGTAADLLAGKQLVDQYGNPLTGTMPEMEQAVPSISVSSSGLITASAAQNAGHVAAGTKNATKQLTTQAGKTVTPGTSRQTAVSSGRYTTGAVYVAGDANLKAENITIGTSIFGVTGKAKCNIKADMNSAVKMISAKIKENWDTPLALFAFSATTVPGKIKFIIKHDWRHWIYVCGSGSLFEEYVVQRTFINCGGYSDGTFYIEVLNGFEYDFDYSSNYYMGCIDV